MTLHLNTFADVLWRALKKLMSDEAFHHFRRVAALSLELGHRESMDIDSFTDSEYGSVDFTELESILRKIFPYVDFLC